MSGQILSFSEKLPLIRMGRTCMRLNGHRNCIYVATVESGGRDLLYLENKSGRVFYQTLVIINIIMIIIMTIIRIIIMMMLAPALNKSTSPLSR